MTEAKRVDEDEFKVPREYVPLDEYIVCSNVVKKSKFLIDDDGLPPVLIGKGEEDVPRIWIYTRDKTSKVITVVEDNIAVYDLAKFDHFDKDKLIIVKVVGRKSSQVVLKVDYNETVKIEKIDLRPLGYNIYGDRGRLKVGNTSLSDSSFENLHSVFGLR